MTRIRLLAFLCLPALAFAVSPQPALQVYPGPVRPLADVVSIRGSNLCRADGTVVGETRINSIDGVKANSFARGYQRDLLVLPGTLNISVWWFFANVHTVAPGQLSLDAQAGHRYIVRAQSDYKDAVHFHIEDLGPGSGATEFVHPKDARGKPSNCY
jgi:hypothetical protein